MKGTICELIANQQQQNPQHIAIIDGQKNVNYSLLLKRANEITHELNNRKVVPGSLIGVCMNRSWELIATLLGVMRAGCAYVPLDPAYPKERIDYMLKHSRTVAAIVDNESYATLCKGVPDLIRIDNVAEQTEGLPVETASTLSATDLAYVIYTSGSTGQPKGVAVEHGGIVAMSQSMGELFDDEDLQGVLAAASICFDTSVMEVMGTLSLGGTVILAKNALDLPKLPAFDQVKTIVMVPSAIQALITTAALPDNLRCLVFGGEALKRSVVELAYSKKPQLRLFNAYGPTEDTVYSTIKEIKPDTKLITIGQSVAGSRSYILDEFMQPVLVGQEGELYLAGNKLARGYLYEEQLTNERFIQMEASERLPENRLYKTGDLCRWTEDKEIEFLGRIDQQVKIRGFRIELEEIESALESMPGVDAAAAAVIDGGIGQKILAAYIVISDQVISESENSKNTINEHAIKAFLATRLPKYMIPQVIRYLDQLPLLPNDKLDRHKLIELEEHFCVEQKATDSSAKVASTDVGLSDLINSLQGNQNQQHTAIMSLIQNELVSLLKLHNPELISPNSSFDSLGLDSLTTLELARRLSNTLGKTLSSNAIIDHPTPSTLTSYIINMMTTNLAGDAIAQVSPVATDTLASFQTHIQSSHPTFQAAKAPSWSAMDKSKLVQEVMRMVNDQRRNPYSKVLRTGSAARGTVTDMYNDDEQQAIIWTTNLYLGLNRDEQVIEQASAALERFGTGMGTSAAASGLTDLHLEFENEFAELVGKPSACLFPTGYTANVGAVAGLLGKNDVVVIDQLCHASIVDGARLCGATIRTFQHNDAQDLEAVLQSEASPYRTILVVLEGVYSMGEGAAPVATIARTAKKYNALVLVDEAHSFGFYGEKGAGICAAQGVTDDVDFIMTTLSKALGSLGGVVAAKQEYVDLLRSSARAFIFQASVSPADIAAALTALRRLRSDEALRARLWDTTRYMRQRFEEAGYDLGTGDGPIVTPHFANKDKLFAIVQELYKRGVQTSAVTYPIVETGRGRLRLICSAAHTKEDVDKTIEALIEAEKAADKLLAHVQQEPTSSSVTQSEIDEGISHFTNDLRTLLEKTTISTPDLALSVSISEQQKPITILLKDGKISLEKDQVSDVTSFSMQLKDKKALSALTSSNVQQLLQSICEGTCVLHGQVEPFIWFIGRLVELQPQSKKDKVVEYKFK